MMRKILGALPYAIIVVLVLTLHFNTCVASKVRLKSSAVIFHTPKVFVDDSGNRILVRRPFKRIISLYGAHTENLFSLGLNREIIGVSRNEAYPPRAMTKPIFSYHDDVEKFIAVHPDLVLIRPMIALGYKNLIARLKESGITVVSLQPRTIKGMFTYWKKLGMLTGKEQEADQMIRKFRAGIRRIKTIVNSVPLSKRKKVYFESIHRRFYTFSPSSISIFALKTAGGINIAPDATSVRGTNIAAYGKEHILSHADDIDVYLAEKGVMNHVTKRRIAEESGFRAIKAIRDNQVYIIDEKIVSRPTLRLLDGIYEIGRILYPSKFNDVTSFEKDPKITRAQFSQIFVKMMNIPLKTPNYYHDIKKRSNEMHKYGEFKDVDYSGNDYKFIETAVYRGIFCNINKYRFYPWKPIKRKDIAYALFVYFDFPEVREIPIQDVKPDNPLFEEIKTVVGLHIMKLSKRGFFMPQKTVSGKELINIISKAKNEKYVSAQ